MLKFYDIPAPPGPYGPAKVMVVMHGRGDVKESFIPFAKEVNVTGLAYRLLDAPTPFMFGHSWYAAAPNDPLPDIENSLALIRQQIDLLERDPSDIFVAGFSQGGAMALELALQSSQAFAGVIAMSPRIFLRSSLIAGARQYRGDVFIAHGIADDVIDFNETKQAAFALQEQGLKIDFHAFEMGHEIDVMEILALRQWLNERL